METKFFRFCISERQELSKQLVIIELLTKQNASRIYILYEPMVIIWVLLTFGLFLYLSVFHSLIKEQAKSSEKKAKVNREGKDKTGKNIDVLSLTGNSRLRSCQFGEKHINTNCRTSGDPA